MRNIPSPRVPGLEQTMKGAAAKNQPGVSGSNPDYKTAKQPGNSASENRRKLQSPTRKFFDSASDRKNIPMKSSSGDRGYMPKR